MMAAGTAGREEPVASMDNSGKIIWARHNEIQTVNVKSLGAEYEMVDGERLPLAIKDLGACDLYPQVRPPGAGAAGAISQQRAAHDARYASGKHGERPGSQTQHHNMNLTTCPWVQCQIWHNSMHSSEQASLPHSKVGG